MPVTSYTTVMESLQESCDTYKANVEWATKMLSTTSDLFSTEEHTNSFLTYHKKNLEYYERYARAIEILKHHGTT
jgi:hypothetical protein